MNTSTANRPIHILVVDEETQIRTVLAEHLGEAGYKVTGASDTDEALAHLGSNADIQGAVVDARLPGRIDGSDLVRRLREEWPHIAVIMTSGHSDALSGEVPEGSQFINKPNLLEHLVPTLRRMIDASR